MGATAADPAAGTPSRTGPTFPTTTVRWPSAAARTPQRSAGGLRTRGYVPDVGDLLDGAARPGETWDLVAPELNGSVQVQFEPRAYAASALTLLYLCRELPDACHAALLIGHNPGIEELAASLGGAQESAPGSGLPDRRRRHLRVHSAPGPPSTPARRTCSTTPSPLICYVRQGLKPKLSGHSATSHAASAVTWYRRAKTFRAGAPPLVRISGGVKTHLRIMAGNEAAPRVRDA